jgi:hypothetical protein
MENGSGIEAVYLFSWEMGHEMWISPALQRDRKSDGTPYVSLIELNRLLNLLEEYRFENVQDTSVLSEKQMRLRRSGPPRVPFTSSDPWYSRSDYSFVAPPQGGSAIPDKNYMK